MQALPAFNAKTALLFVHHSLTQKVQRSLQKSHTNRPLQVIRGLRQIESTASPASEIPFDFDLLITEIDSSFFNRGEWPDFIAGQQVNAFILPLCSFRVPMHRSDSLHETFSPPPAENNPGNDLEYSAGFPAAVNGDSFTLPGSKKNADTHHKIAISNEDKIRFISTKEIIMCQSFNNSSMFYLTSGERMLISKTLKKTEAFLTKISNNKFFRTHQSFLINLRHIKEFTRKDGGRILLANQLEAIVARDKREALFKRLQQYISIG